MKNDYLWDRSGEPDPDIQEMERILQPLRYARPAPEFELQPVLVRKPRRGVRVVMRRAALSLAAVVLFMAGGWWFLNRTPSFEVVSLGGSPRVGAAPLGGEGRLKIGQWLETDASSRARIQVRNIGQVDIEPNSRLRLVEARPAENRLLLQRGILHATIWAPPGQFFVNTPFAEAVDLGCAYTLEVDDDGTGVLQVTSGWVAFNYQGRESFVPAGALCRTRPGTGPGTPFHGDAPPRLQAALDRIDAGTDDNGAALATVLSEARFEDAFTLWHLLAHYPENGRARICERLEQLVAMPQGVTRQGILSGDRRMLDLWWDALGLGDAGWWRMWERPWRESK